MSLPFCVQKSVLGTPQHLFYNDGQITWVDKVPQQTWLFSHKEEASFCLATVLKLNGNEIDSLVPKKYILSMEEAMKLDFDYAKIPWKDVIPPLEYKLFLTGLVKKIIEASNVVDIDYYLKTFSRVTPLFDMLQPAAINVPKLNAYLEDPKTTNLHTLKTFKPIAGSFARVVQYNRLATRTGRLTHEKGPDILTLKKDYRNVLISCFQGGAVKYVDFASLETRIILNNVGEKNIPHDIYESMRERFLPTKTRNVMKLIVLATVFGSGLADLQRLAGITEKKMLTIQQQIREVFHVEELNAKLKLEHSQRNGKIKNAFGRLINVPEERTLVNSFVQSTGVDVSLLGFLWIATRMSELKMESRPILILHDAMLIDTPSNEAKILEGIVEGGIAVPEMSSPFYMEVKDLYTQS